MQNEFTIVSESEVSTKPKLAKVTFRIDSRFGMCPNYEMRGNIDDHSYQVCPPFENAVLTLHYIVLMMSMDEISICVSFDSSHEICDRPMNMQ